MASNINPDLPGPVIAHTKDVRQNFAAAKAEIEAAQAALAALPRDVSLFIPDYPDAGEVVMSLVMARTTVLLEGLAGSLATASVAATASSTWSVRRNGSAIGTFTFAAGATKATFTGVAATLAIGDVLSVIAPDTQDATLSGISITLAGRVSA